MNRETLAQLVPALYRDADRLNANTLAAWLDVVFDEYLRTQGEIATGYDGWFIDTCAEWQVPYIADLVGAGTHAQPSQNRSLVANTIRWRRNKGSTRALGGAAADATGRPAMARDGLSRLAFTQSMRSPQPRAGGPFDVANVEASALIGTAFDRSARTASVRAADPIGPRTTTVYRWTMVTAPIHGSAAGIIPGGFTFDPTGLDTPLYVPPRDGTPTVDTAPAPLSPRLLALEIAARAQGLTPPTSFFGEAAVFRIFAVDPTSGRLTEVPATAFGIADLSDITNPVPDEANAVADPQAWVDVQLGRFTLASTSAIVCYASALTDAIGAWPVAHRLPEWAPTAMRVTGGGDALAAAIGSLPASPADAAIVLADALTYTGTGNPPALALDLAGRRVCIAAQYYTRPALLAGLSVTDSIGGGRLALIGVSIAGSISISGTTNLDLTGCTIVPGHTLDATGTTGGSVRIDRSITGAVSMAAHGAALNITDSIVDGCGSAAVDALDGVGAEVTCTGSTLLGAVGCDSMIASETLFAGPLTVARANVGALRRCWVPAGSVTPLRFDCEPQPPTAEPVQFASVRFGDPTFALPTGPEAIFTAGGDGRAIGAFRRGAPSPIEITATLTDYARAGFAVGVRITP